MSALRIFNDTRVSICVYSFLLKLYTVPKIICLNFFFIKLLEHLTRKNHFNDKSSELFHSRKLPFTNKCLMT